jgi:N-acetylmuramoyl-L-alanine amidase
VFKFPVIIFSFACLFLAGCATQESNEPPPMEWAAPNAAPAPVQHRPAPTLSSAPAPTRPTNTPAVRSNLPPQAPIQTPIVRAAPILTWTSLDRWAKENHLAAPRKISSSPVVSYAVSSASGTFTLVIGSTDASWRGMEIHLGFAPEIVDDQIFIHGLDLQKALEPLLLGWSLTIGPNRVIVLDPGHGGKETGTKSVLGERYEKNFTLDWARRLKPLLETNGWKVFLTRTGDEDIALSNRVAFAEAHHADLFVSLHFNSVERDKFQNGLETFCLTPTGMPSTLTRNYPDIWADHYPNNNFDEQNLLLAVRLHAAILRDCGQEDRGVRHARFMGVLRGQKRPAVLVEGGYLSNPQEAEKIESPAYRQKLAEAVADALK